MNARLRPPSGWRLMMLKAEHTRYKLHTEYTSFTQRLLQLEFSPGDLQAPTIKQPSFEQGGGLVMAGGREGERRTGGRGGKNVYLQPCCSRLIRNVPRLMSGVPLKFIRKRSVDI